MALPADQLAQQHRAIFGDHGPVRLYRAPGRINLIGEHTDYNNGFVLPMAIQRECRIAISPNDGLLEIRSGQEEGKFAYDPQTIGEAQPTGLWVDYVVGVARELHRAGFTVPAANLYVDSTVPTGAGLSSSAAIEVATALALLGESRLEGMQLAQLCQRAEREFVGVPCGIMDQAISVLGRANSALLIDCGNLQTEAVPLPSGLRLYAVNSMVKHALSDGAYETRVRECAAAAQALGIGTLREAKLDAVLSTPMDETVRRRARHVVTENQRVMEFMEASARGHLRRLGELLAASHASLRDDYAVSCEEVDFLVERARQLPGVIGARMVGGGFGGSVLVAAEHEVALTPLLQAYEERYRLRAQTLECAPAAGAGEL